MKQFAHNLVLLSQDDITVKHSDDSNWNEYQQSVKPGGWWRELVNQVKIAGVNPIPVLVNTSNQICCDASLLIFAACIEAGITNILCWQIDNKQLEPFSAFLEHFGD